MLLLFQVCLVLLQDFDTIPLLWGKYLEREKKTHTLSKGIGSWLNLELLRT